MLGSVADAEDVVQDCGRIITIYVVRNPDKLAHVRWPDDDA